MIGLSIIQNGELPTFLTEEMLQAIFSISEPGACLKELQNGIKKVGIYQVRVNHVNLAVINYTVKTRR